MLQFELIIERLKSKIGKAEILALANDLALHPTEEVSSNFNLLLEDNPLAMRWAWLLENTIIPRKELHEVHLDGLANAYLQTKSPSVRRVIGKILVNAKIPEAYEDELYDFTIKQLQKADEPVAVKFHAMNIAAEIALRYPDLATELRHVIEDQIEKNSVAFKAGSKHVFKKLKRKGL